MSLNPATKNKLPIEHYIKTLPFLNQQTVLTFSEYWLSLHCAIPAIPTLSDLCHEQCKCTCIIWTCTAIHKRHLPRFIAMLSCCTLYIIWKQFVTKGRTLGHTLLCAPPSSWATLCPGAIPRSPMQLCALLHFQSATILRFWGTGYTGWVPTPSVGNLPGHKCLLWMCLTPRSRTEWSKRAALFPQCF